MNHKAKQKFPRGWNEKKVRDVIAHYDQQTEEEAAAEIESAPQADGETWLVVPVELVDTVTRLIEDHARNPRPLGHEVNPNERERAKPAANTYAA